MLTLTHKQMLNTIQVHYRKRFGVVVIGVNENDIKSIYEEMIKYWVEEKHELAAKLAQY